MCFHHENDSCLWIILLIVVLLCCCGGFDSDRGCDRGCRDRDDHCC